MFNEFLQMQPDKDSVLGPAVTVPAAKPVHRDNLPTSLKIEGTFMRGPKERKFFKFTLATDKKGRCT